MGFTAHPPPLERIAYSIPQQNCPPGDESGGRAQEETNANLNVLYHNYGGALLPVLGRFSFISKRLRHDNKRFHHDNLGTPSMTQRIQRVGPPAIKQPQSMQLRTVPIP